MMIVASHHDKHFTLNLAGWLRPGFFAAVENSEIISAGLYGKSILVGIGALQFQGRGTGLPQLPVLGLSSDRCSWPVPSIPRDCS